MAVVGFHTADWHMGTGRCLAHQVNFTASVIGFHISVFEVFVSTSTLTWECIDWWVWFVGFKPWCAVESQFQSTNSKLSAVKLDHVHARINITKPLWSMNWLRGGWRRMVSWQTVNHCVLVTDGRVVRAGISVTWNVLSWSGGHEFESQLGRKADFNLGCIERLPSLSIWNQYMSSWRRLVYNDDQFRGFHHALSTIQLGITKFPHYVGLTWWCYWTKRPLIATLQDHYNTTENCKRLGANHCESSRPMYVLSSCFHCAQDQDSCL